MKYTKIISAFPACGKTHFYGNCKDKVVLDSDSSNFSWLDNGERNPNFPENYLEHIKNNIGKADYILVSSHQPVRDALQEEGIEYILILPDSSLKYEWVGRCFLRGSGEKFCNMLADNWDNWTKESHNEYVVRLKSGQYLSDYIEYVDS